MWVCVGVYVNVRERERGAKERKRLKNANCKLAKMFIFALNVKTSQFQTKCL